jgi:hypothetical protein
MAPQLSDQLYRPTANSDSLVSFAKFRRTTGKLAPHVPHTTRLKATGLTKLLLTKLFPKESRMNSPRSCDTQSLTGERLHQYHCYYPVRYRYSTIQGLYAHLTYSILRCHGRSTRSRLP